VITPMPPLILQFVNDIDCCLSHLKHADPG
jgi:hypothetical protein